MFIKTTCNINIDLLTKIDFISSFKQISKSKLIRLLLIDFINSHGTQGNETKRISYQDRDPDKKWHTLHLSLPYDLYEKSIDLRKFCKLSLSFIIAKSIAKYLYKVLQKINKNGYYADNYSFNYIFIFKNCGGVPTFTLCWDLPEQEELQKLRNKRKIKKYLQ